MLRRSRRPLLAVPTVFVAASVTALSPGGAGASARRTSRTPIEHVVVIYQENVSYDHYFGSYPNAANPPGGPAFSASPGTPATNGLTPALLTNNPNAANPARLDRSQALTCDQDHTYTDEQKAADGGKMDRFVEFTGTGKGTDATGKPCVPNQVMDYYDGNTVTALWNYAQHYGMSDNSYNTTYGPSTPGAVNLVSGQTNGVSASSGNLTGEVENRTIIGDPQPLGDDCSTRDQVRLSGTNVGDKLNAKGVTWGFFEGGFAPTKAYDPTAGSKAVCGASHPIGAAIGGTGQWGTKTDYIPHHQPFQYYASTANPHHLPPSSPAMIGRSDQANHQYDLSDFWTAASAGNMPSVSYLKAPGYQDGHAFYSDPLDEQAFLVNTINRLQALPEWSSTAVIISYDDSDGWYDHAFRRPINGSNAPADALDGPGRCGVRPILGRAQDRCGYGPRLPLLVLSPFAKANHVDHTVTDQTSILAFIEDNWGLGRIGNGSFDQIARPLFQFFDFSRPRADGKLMLDPATGNPTG
ncbi:MAG: phospholipase C [Acidimicrobiales bacterium]